MILTAKLSALLSAFTVVQGFSNKQISNRLTSPSIKVSNFNPRGLVQHPDQRSLANSTLINSTCINQQYDVIASINSTIENDPFGYITNLTIDGIIPPGCNLAIDDLEYEMYCDFSETNEGADEYEEECIAAGGRIVPMDVDSACGSTVEIANIGMCVSDSCTDDEYLEFMNLSFDILSGETSVQIGAPSQPQCILDMTIANGLEHTGGISAECLSSGGIISEAGNALDYFDGTTMDDLPEECTLTASNETICDLAGSRTYEELEETCDELGGHVGPMNYKETCSDGAFSVENTPLCLYQVCDPEEYVYFIHGVNEIENLGTGIRTESQCLIELEGVSPSYYKKEGLSAGIVTFISILTVLGFASVVFGTLKFKNKKKSGMTGKQSKEVETKTDLEFQEDKQVNDAEYA